MKKKVPSLLLALLLLMACRFTANQALNTQVPASPSPTVTTTKLPPTKAPAPTATATSVPTPDLSLAGLPSEPAGTSAFDFVGQMCNAKWFSRAQQVPCTAGANPESSGYVVQLDGSVQGLPSNLPILLTFPPPDPYGTLYGEYPAFTVKVGDRFRSVLACRAHTFCDVEFGLEYYDSNGQTGLEHWPYLFADSPIVVDYPLDGLAGKSVQFSLSVGWNGNPSNADAVWIAPHIYRPAP